MAEFAAKHNLHPTFAQWKRQARESPEVFARKPSGGTADHVAEIKAAPRQDGKLTAEIGFSRAFFRRSPTG